MPESCPRALLCVYQLYQYPKSRSRKSESLKFFFQFTRRIWHHPCHDCNYKDNILLWQLDYFTRRKEARGGFGHKHKAVKWGNSWTEWGWFSWRIWMWCSVRLVERARPEHTWFPRSLEKLPCSSERIWHYSAWIMIASLIRFCWVACEIILSVQLDHLFHG